MEDRPRALRCHPSFAEHPPLHTRPSGSVCPLAGVTTATVYRWLQRYQRSGRVSALIPSNRVVAGVKADCSSTPRRSSRRRSKTCILSGQKPSAQHVCVEVLRRCHNAGVTPPHPNTVRYRIHQLSDNVRLRRREGTKQPRRNTPRFRVIFPGADWPLAVVQIDHTPVDLILVDDIHRRPVGRPWMTLAMDVFSRMVAGFYVSFDPPGAMAVGLCLAHAILPKETWLAKYEIATSWPVWGVMHVVHADNAKEFHGRMLHKARRTTASTCSGGLWLGPIMAAILNGCWAPSTMNPRAARHHLLASDGTRRL